LILVLILSFVRPAGILSGERKATPEVADKIYRALCNAI
jgi:hypothetical protein